MNRKLTGLIAALALALVGTIVLVGYVRTAEARAVAGEKLVDILVVGEPIEAGTAAAEIEALVRTEQVPAKVRASGAIVDLAELKGLVAAVDLLPGEQVLRERFVTPAVQQRGETPSGLLEVTIALDPQRALGGRLAVGDTVGVIASFDGNEDGPAQSHLVLHKVLVTGVQGAPAVETEDDEVQSAPSEQLLVTLAVDAASAEQVVYMAEHGRIWLTGQPTDAAETGTKVVTRGNVYA